MTATPAPLPAGYTQYCLDHVDSTNSEALRRAAGDASLQKHWIRACRQDAGRGRSGRLWVSEKGNLFASLLLRPECTVRQSVQLAFVAGLAAHDTVVELAADVQDRLALKWPNDLLLDGAKLGGILLESGTTPGTGKLAVVIGTGLNLKTHPADGAIGATDLATQGWDCAPDDAFQALAEYTARWLDVWNDGTGWNAVRAAWLSRSIRRGREISVKMGDRTLAGTFCGVDAEGALLLADGSEAEIAVTAGDVFLK